MIDFDPFADMSDDELDAFLEGEEGSAESVSSGLPEGFRSGFVALVGRPNAGKSTLLNACFGEKVAITSPVAQTTRRRMRAVINRDRCQIVIVDTPGLHKPKDSLGTELNKSALAEINDVDVVAFLIDASAPIGRGDEWVANHVAKSRARKILVLSKADKVKPEQMLAQLEAARKLVDFDDELVISAPEGFNVDTFVSVVASYLPEGPKWFPDDMKCDASDETLVSEFVREKVLLHTREEIPHAVGVLCDELEFKGDLLRVHATIYVEREGQKGILVGKRGEMVKRIGMEARRDIERIFDCRVYLGLDVRVKSGWREDEGQIHRFGYGAEE
ncbi:GTPase Era [Collinsella sp. D33t1_170424_A12]|uniref:GTPase Era n=1 Tax=Collinsella sp. D33t1_170424_A12 TaxID=2787135 RepID=UPI001899B6F4|nr:GTPase Era [Collinsella sp. D33t1_170424_A12]